jgi:hypothetical protein
MSTIPSFYQTRDADTEAFSGNNSNSLLRIGLIYRVIAPEDADSRSKKVVEYDVLVNHKENGATTGVLYHNCVVANPLGGKADKETRILRPDKNTGLGTRVLILCINGEQNSGMIISGVRSTADSDKGIIPVDRTKDFARFEWEYNGINFLIQDDGSVTVTYKGATKNDGNLRDSVDKKAVGTSLNINKDGDFKVATRDQYLELNHKDNVLKIFGKNRLTLHAENIDLGNAATEQAVLGNTLVKFIQSILDEISKIQVITAVGTSSPPTNIAAFASLRAQASKILSSFIKLKKTP